MSDDLSAERGPYMTYTVHSTLAEIDDVHNTIRWEPTETSEPITSFKYFISRDLNNICSQ